MCMTYDTIVGYLWVWRKEKLRQIIFRTFSSISFQGKTVHINPLALMICIAFASSFTYILPVSTPPNAIVYAYARFSLSDMVSAVVFKCYMLLDFFLVCNSAWIEEFCIFLNLLHFIIFAGSVTSLVFDYTWLSAWISKVQLLLNPVSKLSKRKRNSKGTFSLYSWFVNLF